MDLTRQTSVWIPGLMERGDGWARGRCMKERGKGSIGGGGRRRHLHNTHIHTHTHTHAYTHTCTRTHACTCTRTHACTYTHSHTHTQTHTHIHTRASNIQAVMLLYQSRVQVVHLLPELRRPSIWIWQTHHHNTPAVESRLVMTT